VTQRLNIPVYPLHGAVRADDDGGADHSLAFFPVQGFRAPGAVLFMNRRVRVGEQREGERIFFRPRFLRGGFVAAYADDRRLFFLETVLRVPEPGRLRCSAAGVGLGVEKDHQALSGELRQ